MVTVFLFSIVLHELLIYSLFDLNLSCYLSFEMLWQFALHVLFRVLGISVRKLNSGHDGEFNILVRDNYWPANADSDVLLREPQLSIYSMISLKNELFLSYS